MKTRLLPLLLLFFSGFAFESLRGDQVFNPPRYLYLITSRSTTEGATQERTYVLWPDRPPANGVLEKGDGDGSTRSYRVQFLAGPLYSLSQACAQTQLPPDALRAIGCAIQAPPVPQTNTTVEPTEAPSKRHRITWEQFFKNMLKLIGGGAIIIMVLSWLSSLFNPPKPEAAVMIVGADSGAVTNAPPLDPTGNVTRTFLPKWPEQAESELQILIDENLRAAGSTAWQFMDETDVLKVGTGMAEVLNILDDLEAKAAAGKLTNAQAQAGILSAFKHLGLDFLRAANLVMMLKALANLGAGGIRALRNKLVSETKVAGNAVAAGVAAEAEITEAIVQRGGFDLNNMEKLAEKTGGKLPIRGGKGKFPIVDVIDEGMFTSIATSEQKSLSYLRGKWKVLFEANGSQHTQNQARTFLSKVVGQEITELSFQAKARLVVPRARLAEMQAFIRERVREVYMSGKSGSAFADHLVNTLRAQKHTEEAILQAVTDLFLKRVVGR